MINPIEILSPAGGPDSVAAAVHAGADAIYVGAKAFSARGSAKNFDADELKDCVRYCHERGVKVYLALNTLIFDDELEPALRLAIDAARADIDAVIVQDIGLVQLIRQAVPALPLHASTQMSIHTPYGAKALYEMGFKRVVLSRELSLDEIREIHDFCPEVELEVFVHGALCMCVSGQCWFSAMLGGRSANRGMCAQPCRLPMSFGGNPRALSLKDNSIIEYIPALAELGVASAKIEGRMKRPEYVAAATAACAEMKHNGNVSRETSDRLRSVFSRTGFTDGYIRGKLGADMFGYRTKDDVVSADPRLLRDIRNAYKDERKSVGVRFTFTAKCGEKPHLTAFDGVREVEVTAKDAAEEARTLPLTEEKARQNLSKTGNTPYFVEQIDCTIDQNVSVPLSTINTLRREALDELSALRSVRHHYEINQIDIENLLSQIRETSDMITDYAVVGDPAIPPGFRLFGMVFADLSCIERIDRSRVKALGVEIPRVLFGSEQAAYDRLRPLKAAGVEHALVHNIGAFYMAKELGFRIHGGFGLNLTNSLSLCWARDYGAESAELSIEVDLRRAGRLHCALPVGLIAYGYMPMMITRNAPAGMPGKVSESCKNESFLQDRKGESFRIRRCGDAYEIYNCVPLLMPEEINSAESGFFNVFRFSVENSVDNKEKTLENLQEKRRFERFTHGLYQKGVKKLTSD